MKRILLVNHYWPPTGGPAVQRWLDFAQSILDYGHHLEVLTPTDAAFPWYDESLLARVPKGLRVHRIGANMTVSSARKMVGDNKFTRFVRGNFFLPDPRKSWNPLAIAFIEARLDQFDLLITAGPPQSTHLIGLALRDKLTWVVDLHDYWTDAVYLKDFYRTRIAHAMDLRTENAVLRSADLILAHSRTAVQSYTARTNTPVELIWMGYYAGHYQSSPPPIRSSVITHIGTLYGSYQNALAYVRELQAEGLQFRQIGHVDRTLQLPENTILPGYLSHAEAIKATRESDQLLIIIPYANVVPGKLFEYFAARRPIRCFAPPGSEIQALIDEYADASPDIIRDTFSRRSIAIRLAQRLDALP
ncbi:MAG: glycosyltransferase [Bacteroidota bacterium]